MNKRLQTQKLLFRSLFLPAILILAIACGDGDSDTTETVLVPTAIVSTVVTTPTSDVEVIEIIETPVGGPDSLATGSSSWWESKAPVTDFRVTLPVLAGSPTGDAIWESVRGHICSV